MAAWACNCLWPWQAPHNPKPAPKPAPKPIPKLKPAHGPSAQYTGADSCRAHLTGTRETLHGASLTAVLHLAVPKDGVFEHFIAE